MCSCFKFINFVSENDDEEGKDYHHQKTKCNKLVYLLSLWLLIRLQIIVTIKAILILMVQTMCIFFKNNLCILVQNPIVLNISNYLSFGFLDIFNILINILFILFLFLRFNLLSQWVNIRFLDILLFLQLLLLLFLIIFYFLIILFLLVLSLFLYQLLFLFFLLFLLLNKLFSVLLLFS